MMVAERSSTADPTAGATLSPSVSEAAVEFGRLSIVIPALNEEEAIGGTISRCLEAAPGIMQQGGVGAVEVIAVSDGSTDRTVEIAEAMADADERVSLIVFPKNRGYGAAIKAGFERSTGDLVAFLDADGTCDPRVFGPMCRRMAEENAEVVLGSRMGPESEMPLIRTVGNTVFAWVLGACSGKAVSDTASGMRVLRRSSLPRLYPLPDGLHFTPAMSARALMRDVAIVEVPMPYAERLGQSKLSVVRDGLRFARSIVDALLLYRPGRLLYAVAAVLLMVAAAWALYPTEFYLRNGRLEEWMRYRFWFCSLLTTAALAFVVGGAIGDRVAGLALPGRKRTFGESVVSTLLHPRAVLVAIAASLAGAVWFVWPGAVNLISTGVMDSHWSRFAAAVFCGQSAAILAAYLVVRRVLSLWGRERGERA